MRQVKNQKLTPKHLPVKCMIRAQLKSSSSNVLLPMYFKFFSLGRITSYVNNL